jgi:hypothetical protein
MVSMADWQPVTGGWMSEPDREEDTVPVVLTDRWGDPVAMTRLDVDYFGEIDDALVPDELIDAELTAHWWDEPKR